jgi:hypothetical protein
MKPNNPNYIDGIVGFRAALPNLRLELDIKNNEIGDQSDFVN